MKVCPYCAEELADEVVECPHCGRDTTVVPDWAGEPTPRPAPSAEQIVRRSAERAAETAPARRGSVGGLALAAFLAAIGVGIAGTATSFPPALGFLVHGAVVALGVAAMAQTRGRPEGGTGFAFAAAAVVLGALGLIGYGRQLIG